MAKALSVDLRQRVIEAISQGMSRRQAAARFGVSASSAIRWAAQLRTTGNVAPKKQGGDRKSGRIEAQAAFSTRWPECPTSVLLSSRPSWTSVACASASAHSGASSAATASHAKKDRACGRAAAQRCESGAPSLVRGAARSRPQTAGLH